MKFALMFNMCLHKFCGNRFSPDLTDACLHNFDMQCADELSVDCWRQFLVVTMIYRRTE